MTSGLLRKADKRIGRLLSADPLQIRWSSFWPRSATMRC